MMNKDITVFTAIFCIGAGVGIFSFTATALETRWLYTESDFKRSLAYQETQDMADVCGAIGKREWAEDDKASSAFAAGVITNCAPHMRPTS
jgi:hypothetical protein